MARILVIDESQKRAVDICSGLIQAGVRDKLVNGELDVWRDITDDARKPNRFSKFRPGMPSGV